VSAAPPPVPAPASPPASPEAPATAPRPERDTPRRRAIVAAAREILETAGAEALTMRRLGEALGIRAPSLYKHFPDKAAVEAALLDAGFREAGAALSAAVGAAPEPVAAFAAAYRAFARTHPHLYRLMTGRPLPRADLTPGVEQLAAAPLVRAAGGDLARARALWGLVHGLVQLELTGRFPPGADVDAAWAAGIAAFAGRPEPPASKGDPQ
jgi:AcrR family transcriptional regulator